MLFQETSTVGVLDILEEYNTEMKLFRPPGLWMAPKERELILENQPVNAETHQKMKNIRLQIPQNNHRQEE